MIGLTLKEWKIELLICPTLAKWLLKRYKSRNKAMSSLKYVYVLNVLDFPYILRYDYIDPINAYTWNNKWFGY